MADPNYTFDFSMLQTAATSFVGSPAGAAAGATGGAPAAAAGPTGDGDPTALIAASPFGALLNLPGVSATDILASLSQGNGAGALAALGTDAGNPFNSVTGANDPFPAGTANAFDNELGANNPFASSGNPFAMAASTTGA